MRFLAAAVALTAFAVPTLAAEPTPGTYTVGVAKIDITPAYPVRLSGFGSRRTESEGVTQRIWAKALAIDDGEPAVLITVDNLGIPSSMTREVADRLAKKAGLKPERLAITATHTHTAPMLKGVAPTLFGMPIPKEHQEHIDRYTAELTDKLEQVALAALADRRPARLTWGIGKVGFAVNRRTKGGPVDHDLPLLVVRDLQGKVRALYVSYACHCVTLSNNKISGDWAGYAQERIEDDYPGAIALVSIGCGADANPNSGVTGDKADVASRQGAEVADEVKQLLHGYLSPVTGKLSAVVRPIELPFAEPPKREEWERRAQRKDAIGYHAQVQLQRLDPGEALQKEIVYPVQTWAFGDALAMVFLPGEVVVDYSHRLKRELDGLRLWVNAYSNDAPCYIPSERVLKEGGYEGGAAMVYYDRPGPFAPGLENKIIEAVHAPLDAQFKAGFDTVRTGGARPLSPQQSLTAIRAKNDLAVELMVAEPLVISPVAIDWGPDGRLWVAEMFDYPMGKKGDYKPGGRVRVLESTRSDGVYDRATVFLDNIPFPTGIRVWRKGVLVCAAPDILYAEDTKRDGKADVVKKLYSGFGTDNYQARVNSLEYGLDGWVYGSCGLFGGRIRNFKGDEFALGDRDFRIKPDEGLLEPATGRTQQGRVRNDWGDWFGCDNSNLCWHYPLADHYLRRNPHVAPPPAAVLVPDAPDPNRLYPIKADLQLFKLSGPPGRTTAACGLGIYRDELLGEPYRGNAYVCEPVNLMVHRLLLSPRGSTFAGRRAADEAQSEFLASTDNWFRPVQVRTGPDGCLWVVDMYRYVIEHPRWIPPEDLAKLDVRAGAALGRIYRIRPKDREPRPMPRLDRLDTAGLVAALDSPNGWQRDLAGQMLLWQRDRTAVDALEKLAATSPRPECRLHALCVLGGLGQLRSGVVEKALGDRDGSVRRHAVRLTERFNPISAEMSRLLIANAREHPDAQVRLQLACTLGEVHGPSSNGILLGTLAARHGDDPYLLAAVLSSMHARDVVEVVHTVLEDKEGKQPSRELARRLVGVAVSMGDPAIVSALLNEVMNARQQAGWKMAVLAGALEAMARRGQTVERIPDAAVRDWVHHMLGLARLAAVDSKETENDRTAAIDVLGRDAGTRAKDLATLGELLTPQQPGTLQSEALAALGRIGDERAAVLLTAGWQGFTPTLKSQVLDLLLGRAAWQPYLLSCIEKGEVPAAQIDAKHRQRLLESPDHELRARAVKAFAGAVNADRRKVLDAYRDVATTAGDRSRGKAIFAKTCSTCHRLEGVGHVVGPDLASLSNKSPHYLLQEILDPNRNVDTRYVEYVAVTKAGQTVTGILAGETATAITLRGQEGKEQVLLRAELEELRSSGKSLMPEGLEKDLTKQDLADLITYLAGSASAR